MNGVCHLNPPPMNSTQGFNAEALACCIVPIVVIGNDLLDQLGNCIPNQEGSRV
jgi:hypothetical protein